MFLVSFCLLTSLILIFLLNIASMALAEAVHFNREDSSSYECGFDHHNLSRVPFSLRYYFLTLLFLLFDLEIILLVFSPLSIFSSLSWFSLLVVFLFVLFLFLTLIYEWSDGALEWVS